MEESTPSSDYIKGFNAGYLMERELPDLAKILSSVKESTDHMQGFQDGRKEFLLQRARQERLRSNKSTDKKIDRAKDLDKDIGRE